MLNNKYKLTLIAILTLGTFGCTDSDSDDNDVMSDTSTFSLGLSDAPVDEAQAVFIELDSITLTKSTSDGEDEGERDEVVVDTFTNDAGESVDTIQVNLLDFQGSEQLKIIDETQNIELDNANYSMTLNVIDSGSYVLLDGDDTEYAIKVPSSKLQLGEFTVSSEAVQVGDAPAYTLEFDLRQSLVQRGNNTNNNGYIVKPQGVRIVSLSGNLAGTVSSELTNLGQCTVYLYGSDVTEFGDMFDADDETFVAPESDITATVPLATTIVADDGSYEIGFIEQGSYQVALTCGTEIDDNIQFDGLTIPSAADLTPDVVTVEISPSTTTTQDF
jgi:hypothetical protein